MATKLLVITPITVDGTNPLYDSDNNIQYKKTYASLGARIHLESENAKLPERLRHKIEEIEADSTSLPSEDAIKANEEVAIKNAEIENLKAQLEKMKTDAAKAEADQDAKEKADLKAKKKAEADQDAKEKADLKAKKKAEADQDAKAATT